MTGKLQTPVRNPSSRAHGGDYFDNIIYIDNDQYKAKEGEVSAAP
jgi:hypothetical protein